MTTTITCTLSATARRARYDVRTDAEGRAYARTQWSKAWHACAGRDEVTAHEASLVANAEAWSWWYAPNANPALHQAVDLARDFHLDLASHPDHPLTLVAIDAVAQGTSVLVALARHPEAIESAIATWVHTRYGGDWAHTPARTGATNGEA